MNITNKIKNDDNDDDIIIIKNEYQKSIKKNRPLIVEERLDTKTKTKVKEDVLEEA